MSFEFNKIFGAVVFAMLVAYIAGFIARESVHAEEGSEMVAFPVEGLKLAEATPPGGAAAPAAPQAEPISALLAAADVGAGQKTSRACTACHNFDKGGANKVGPALWGIVDRVVANVEGFAYSEGMKSLHDRKWGYDELNKFLFAPKAHVPGTKMAYAGVKDTKERANLIAYLRSLADTPADLPK